MKKILPLLLMFVMGFAWNVQAQMLVELSFPRHVYMQYEKIIAHVKIRNYSGQPLIFGKSDSVSGKLCFDVRLNGKIMPAYPDREYPMTGVIFQAGETKEFDVILSNYHKMTALGYYTVHAYVQHSQMKHEFKSRDVRLEVAPGSVTWSRKVGIPDVIGKKQDVQQQVATRTFTVRQLRENVDTVYYVIVEDEKRIYAIFTVGKKIGQESIRAEVDMLSRLHLLVPVSPKLFRNLVINLDGKVEKDQMYKTTSSIPSLSLDRSTGQVFTVGGAEALVDIDYRAPNEKSLKK